MSASSDSLVFSKLSASSESKEVKEAREHAATEALTKKIRDDLAKISTSLEGTVIGPLKSQTVTLEQYERVRNALEYLQGEVAHQLAVLASDHHYVLAPKGAGFDAPGGPKASDAPAGPGGPKAS